MTKKNMKEIAKDTLMESIAVAYYRLENVDYTEDEVEQISTYIKQYGEAMGKAIRREYYTM